MDLVKSTQSEDLPKDLPRNPWISPQNHEGFHDEKMNRIERKLRNKSNTDRLASKSNLCSDL